MTAKAREIQFDLVGRALADPTRRKLLRLVRDEQRAAGELATYFPTISRPAVSQHLGVLHDAGLVTVSPQGNHRMYRTRAEGLSAMSEFIDEMWTDSLARLKRAAESAELARFSPTQQRRSQ